MPWLTLLRSCRPRQAWWWSYAIGVVFFLGSMWWLVHVTVLGWLILCAYLALYFAVFGRLAYHCMAQGGPGFLLIPAIWVALEYARSHLLSGFGWNLLAYSQTSWYSLIQVADMTGVWGVSFLIVWVNVAITEWLQARGRSRSKRRRRTAPRIVVRPLAAATSAVLLVLGYGLWRIQHVTLGAPVRLAVVQGNIPQERKWHPDFAETILQRYESLTRNAASAAPQLIIWPETAVPGYLDADEPLTQRVQTLVRTLHIPLLTGAPMVRGDSKAWLATNSATLLDETGTLKERYDKIHLVPFGEFIPFERLLPWFRAILPPIGDFVPGHERTVFRLGSRLQAPGSRPEQLPPASSLQPPAISFSVLICFEDIFPDLARRFVREGARLLVVITNDAWFGPTAAAYQHAQASTFRAVELRVPVVRAANTGWSGCIDATGRWIGSMHDAHGRELFVAGTHTCEVRLGTEQTLVLRWGDWFALLCVLGAMAWIAYNRLHYEKRQ